MKLVFYIFINIVYFYLNFFFTNKIFSIDFSRYIVISKIGGSFNDFLLFHKGQSCVSDIKKSFYIKKNVNLIKKIADGDKKLNYDKPGFINIKNPLLFKGRYGNAIKRIIKSFYVRVDNVNSLSNKEVFVTPIDFSDLYNIEYYRLNHMKITYSSLDSCMFKYIRSISVSAIDDYIYSVDYFFNLSDVKLCSLVKGMFVNGYKLISNEVKGGLAEYTFVYKGNIKVILRYNKDLYYKCYSNSIYNDSNSKSGVSCSISSINKLNEAVLYKNKTVAKLALKLKSYLGLDSYYNIFDK